MSDASPAEAEHRDIGRLDVFRALALKGMGAAEAITHSLQTDQAAAPVLGGQVEEERLTAEQGAGAEQFVEAADLNDQKHGRQNASEHKGADAVYAFELR